ncbi:hypothetical protein DC498_01955 [Terrimonas sp.]|nr:hypothetical protein DC498_01955 [Terrimonas sp.]
MINAVMEFLFEFFIRFFFVFPGAFICWMFKSFKGSYKKVLENSDWEINALTGIAVTGGIILLIVNV